MSPHDAVELPLNFSAETGRNPLLSPWSCSCAKRLFDVAVVVAMIPLLMPLLLAIALAIVVSCGRPVLFRQQRAGRYGRPFTIFKFRTMVQASSAERAAIAAHRANEITPLGRLLRRAKLDELPQVWNVLVGDMSLVGPRPKIPDQQLFRLECRPGLTGSATLAFACEERLFAEIARDRLDAYYHQVVLPAKHRLDAEYMARATIFSDLRMLLFTAFGRWQKSVLNPAVAGAFSLARSAPPRDWNPHAGDGRSGQDFAELSPVCHSIVADGS